MKKMAPVVPLGPRIQSVEEWADEQSAAQNYTSLLSLSKKAHREAKNLRAARWNPSRPIIVGSFEVWIRSAPEAWQRREPRGTVTGERTLEQAGALLQDKVAHREKVHVGGEKAF